MDISLDENSMSSRFEGSVFVYILYQIAKIVLSIGTGFLLYPLTVFLYEKWLCGNSFVEGRRLQFIGKLWKVYLIYILGVLLISLSLFVFNFVLAKISFTFSSDITKWGTNAFLGGMNTVFITSKMRKWKKANTIFAGNEECNNSFLDRSLIKCALVIVVFNIANTISLGLLIPLAKKIKAEFFINLTTICGEKLYFAGKAISLYKKLPLWILFIILSLGLYILYINFYLQRWEVENTLIKRGENIQN